MGEYGSIENFLLSFVQNLVGQFPSMSNIYLSLQQNFLNNDLYRIHYNFARLTKVLIIFDPVVIEDVSGSG